MLDYNLTDGKEEVKNILKMDKQIKNDIEGVLQNKILLFSNVI